MIDTDELIGMINKASRVYIDSEALLQTDKLTALISGMICNNGENKLIVTSRTYGEVCDALYNKEKQAEEALTLMTLHSEVFTFDKEILSEEPAVNAGMANVLLRYWNTGNKGSLKNSVGGRKSITN